MTSTSDCIDRGLVPVLAGKDTGLAAMDHTTRAVLVQRQVDGAPNEVTGFQPLLAGLDLAGAVVTADAA